MAKAEPGAQPQPSTERAKGAARDAKNAVSEAKEGTRQAAVSPWAVTMMRLGVAAKGLVYVIMGGLAAAAALGRGGATTDTKGAVRVLALGSLGHLLLLVVAVCLFGYVLWCLARAIFDLDHVGNGVKGIVSRVGYAVLGIAYIGLALAALQIGLGGSGGASSDQQTRDVTATLMRSGLGTALVALGGVVMLCVALALVRVVWQADFMKHFKHSETGAGLESALRWLGRLGYGALAVVTAEIGIFLIVAALRHDPGETRGLGSALATLAAQPNGHLPLAVVALGLIAFGVFSFAEARYRWFGPR
ncbi:MAG TPA: DUF1206 domain-containing protein [Ktedonobacterales bacterium]|nr:DUF1206 domain-containing protein [Ktedonobacterales bacterium]